MAKLWIPRSGEIHLAKFLCFIRFIRSLIISPFALRRLHQLVGIIIISIKDGHVPTANGERSGLELVKCPMDGFGWSHLQKYLFYLVFIESEWNWVDDNNTYSNI